MFRCVSPLTRVLQIFLSHLLWYASNSSFVFHQPGANGENSCGRIRITAVSTTHLSDSGMVVQGQKTCSFSFGATCGSVFAEM